MNNMKANDNEYGSYYMPTYEGQIQLFVDADGTEYTVNQDKAEFEYLWTNGEHGIGYYRRY